MAKARLGSASEILCTTYSAVGHIACSNVALGVAVVGAVVVHRVYRGRLDRLLPRGANCVSASARMKTRVYERGCIQLVSACH
jgi:hypothetical protein